MVLQGWVKTEVSELAEMFSKAQAAQLLWSKLSPHKRAQKLVHLRETIARRSDEIAALIERESGKPASEALTQEILPTLAVLTAYAKTGPRTLRDRKIKKASGSFLLSKLELTFFPLGTVAIFGPWNNSFAVAVAQIAAAIMAGNAVIFKPSERAYSVGTLIQSLFFEAGFPVDLLHCALGESDLGKAICDQHPGKIYFSGSRKAAEQILHQSADALIPVQIETLESGSMIVLPDANLDFASSAAVWAAFANLGHARDSLRLVLVHDSIHAEFRERFEQKCKKLGPNHDLSSQRASFPELISFAALEDSIRKLNETPSLQSAIILGRNEAVAQELARELRLKKVSINAAMNDSQRICFIHAQGAFALEEFSHSRQVMRSPLPWFPLKAWSWFPHSPYQRAFAQSLVRTYRGGRVEKLLQFPHLLWCLIKFLKNEPRL